jgi:hypothetical protein
MEPSAQLRVRPWAWVALAVLLLLWNGMAARYASPFCMIHASDGTQYHLLVRNRLHGHTEVGDRAHTVRQEGQHPIWRPGLVWIEEMLAPWLGSVQASAAAAGALGTTLLELALLWLAWRCFGIGVFAVVLVCLLTPVQMMNFLQLAFGQGPEPWAAAMIILGLAALVEALRRQSLTWAVLAGALGAFAEWFRTGNMLLFLVPCGIYGLAALVRRDWLGLRVPVLGVVGFGLMGAVGGLTEPSPVPKTTVNLWHRIRECDGPRQGGLYLGGLELAPNGEEDWFDYTVHESRGMSAWQFFRAHSDEILGLYFSGLGDVFRHGASGARELIGWPLTLLFVLEVLLNLASGRRLDVDSLAFAAGALAHYLGPIVLFRGDDNPHYLLVALPLIVLVAARGAVRLAGLVAALVERWRPTAAKDFRLAGVVCLGLVLIPLACGSVLFYRGTLHSLRDYQERAREEQAAIDSLGLEGKKIGCRNLTYFIDRDVSTVFIPYGMVPELEEFARAQRLDGLLVCLDEEHEPQDFFRVMPYADSDEFEQAMAQSSVFGSPRTAGGWQWYPVRRPDSVDDPSSREVQHDRSQR